MLDRGDRRTGGDVADHRHGDEFSSVVRAGPRAGTRGRRSAATPTRCGAGSPSPPGLPGASPPTTTTAVRPRRRSGGCSASTRAAPPSPGSPPGSAAAAPATPTHPDPRTIHPRHNSPAKPRSHPRHFPPPPRAADWLDGVRHRLARLAGWRVSVTASLGWLVGGCPSPPRSAGWLEGVRHRLARLAGWRVSVTASLTGWMVLWLVHSARTTSVLRRLADAALPADGSPSGVEAGVSSSWNASSRRIARTGDHGCCAPSNGGGRTSLRCCIADDGLGRVLADSDGGWLVRLLAQGFYASPAGWEMAGWRPDAGGGWESVEFGLPVTSREGLGERYDCVIVGSGAGGGAAAQVVAESGRSVLVVETGRFPATAELDHDHLRNPRSVAGLPAPTDPDMAGRPRISVVDGVRRVVLPPDGGWGNNAFTVGGGTRVYGAQAWRFVPQDFRMATTYGVPEGSALADWPISYEDLEPYYSLAEQRFGVSGGGTDPWHEARSIPLPMPPLPRTAITERLATAAERLGWGTLDVPLLINSEEYQGRSACVRCGQCVGFACPVEAKAGTHNTALPAALATGLCTLVTETTVERLVVDDRGRVTGVALVAAGNDGRIWRRTVDCADVILAAGATETPRLVAEQRARRRATGAGQQSRSGGQVSAGSCVRRRGRPLRR